MAYKVEFTFRAEKDLRRLDAAIAAKVVAKIEALAADPQQVPGVKQLKGTWKGVSRIRVGDYRILYQLQDAVLLILIVAIGNRKDVYS